MERIALEDADVRYEPDWLTATESARLFRALREDTAWRAERIRVFGREHPVPRLQAWHGEPDAEYSYSGLDLVPLPWNPALAELLERLSACAAPAPAGRPFNSALVNLYRDGRDSNGWHSDDEPELGPAPFIASISLGAPRTFRMRHRTRRDLPVWSCALAPGSLLVMAGPTQRAWKHSVPKTSRPVGERINVTFRHVLTSRAGPAGRHGRSGH